MLYGSREPFAGGGQGEYVRFSDRLVYTGSKKKKKKKKPSVRGLGSGAFLTPGFGILDKFFPESRIPNAYF
jgi:hypothetical protein